ncbi:membrane protein insertion efficiency factor YidD [Pelagibacterium limicola]|uniref:membrane protein insertion efficiency factor YidD n=1 Tax=Pelagibacterium limicola TaxID=2791022 RepID=UPI0018AFDAE2|nr:membrane protein insertion efficiency factor YidD [Pelagibacterium limicola]
MRTFWTVLDFPFKWMSYALIQFYRYTFSAFMGRNCRHAPSCSEFTRDAILQHGFWPGGWMGAGRIWRCRPGGTHGYDPVPEMVPEQARWYMPWRYARWRGDTHEHA